LAFKFRQNTHQKDFIQMARPSTGFPENLRMWLSRLVAALYPTLIPVPVKTSEARANALAHDLVRRYARSNVNLQKGRYVTAEDLEARKRVLALHSF
jgi:hypothetical protein